MFQNTNATKFFLVLSILSLACVQSANIGTGDRTNTQTPQATTTSSPQVMTVSAYTLNVRDSAGGTVISDFWLIRGRKVAVYNRDLDAYGNEWCQISSQYQYWVACWWLEEK